MSTKKSLLERDLTMAFIDCDVHMLKRYLDLMEAQLEEARNIELSEVHARLQMKNEAQQEDYYLERKAIERKPRAVLPAF